MTNKATLVDLLQGVLDDYDDTGCEGCGVISADLVAEIEATLKAVKAQSANSGIDAVIARIKALSEQSSDGGVSATIEADWGFAVTIALEKDEVAGLDESALRAALGAQVDEMVDMTRDAGDAIDVGELLAIRDGGTDAEIALDEIES